MTCMHAKLLQSCLTLCNAMDYNQPGSFVLWDSPGKNNEVGCHFLLPGWLKQHLFLMVLETGKSKIKALVDAVLRTHFLVHREPSSHCVLKWQKENERAFWSHFYKGTNSIHEDSTLMT